MIDRLKNKLKLSEHEFKKYLIERYVDDNGDKVSDRAVWGQKDFWEHTGMFKVNKFTGERTTCSCGTISYYKTKLELKEEDVFRYHQLITGKIDRNLEYEDWSRKYNKGYKRQSTLTQETIKRRLIKFAGVSDTYNHLTFDKVHDAVMRVWERFGYNANEEMEKFYDSLRGDLDG